MAYNPYSAVNAIYNLKGQWDTANSSNDTVGKNNAAKKAQAYYNQLRKNGYSDVADALTASNYAQAKNIRDKWAKMGKTSTRDYLYTLGQSKGMSRDDVDKLISWDNQSGEVSFGGKKIGVPDTIVDGVSYWKDTSVLDNAFNDYVSRSGTVRDKDMAINQENENLFAKYNREYEDLKNENPFETETGKAILAKYNLAGLQGRDNAVASDAGSNGGNIDSFAAANAMRQQAALINKGQMTALEAHQQKLDHAKALLSDMGVNIDRVFNQNETAKNNDVARKSERASVTGYTPAEWTIQNDSFLKNFVDENGKLKQEYSDVDFQELINKAKADGNTDLANKYAILRGLKIFGNFAKYGKYLNEGDVAYVESPRTADFTLTNKQIDSAERISKSETDATLAAARAQAQSNENVANINAQADKDVANIGAQANKEIANIQAKNALDQLKYGSTEPSLSAAQASAAIKNGEISQAVLDAYNFWYGTNYTIDNPPTVNDNNGTDDLGGGGTGGGQTIKDTYVGAWADMLNREISSKYGSNFKAIEVLGNGQYKAVASAAEYIADRVLKSNSLSDEQKQYLLIDKFGISPSVINTMLKDTHHR